MKLLSARYRAWNQPFPPSLLRPCDAALFKLQELVCFLNYFYLPGKTITGNYQSTSWGGPIRRSSENLSICKIGGCQTILQKVNETQTLADSD